MTHPTVGRLALTYDRMTVTGDEDLYLYVYTTEPGSEADEKLSLLASWAASEASAEPSISSTANAKGGTQDSGF